MRTTTTGIIALLLLATTATGCISVHKKDVKEPDSTTSRTTTIDHY